MVTILPAVSVRENAIYKSYSRTESVIDLPNLIQTQINSFQWFKKDRLRGLFEEITPIEDFTGSRLQLHLMEPEFREPKYSEKECRQREKTYEAPLWIKARLQGKEIVEPREQDVFLGDIPIMTDNGTFIINGAERVVVSQLLRSPGVYFTSEEDVTSGRKLCHAKLIPDRGAWLEFETSQKDVVSVKVDGKKRVSVTTLLRALGYGSDEELSELFKDVDRLEEHHYIQSTLDREPNIKSERDALIDIYTRLRPGEPPTEDNARSLISNLFFNSRRYDLGRVGRHKLNKRIGASLLNLAKITSKEAIAKLPPDELDKLVKIHFNKRVLSKHDLVAIIRHIIMVNNELDNPDDIDHLGNRRLRTVGELLHNQFRMGLLIMERMVKERMSIVDTATVMPANLVNVRPIVAAMKEFFGGSQLSQFMDQTNPLAELTHKRRVSALGPGGLSRERAGFDVRDVHHSHYGRICPIETPEGPNIGLIGSLATYARVNDFGFIETPYRKVYKEVKNTDPNLLGRTISADVSQDGVSLKKGTVINDKLMKKLVKLSERHIPVRPFVSTEVSYLSADVEEHYSIAQASARFDELQQLIDDVVEVRSGGGFSVQPISSVAYMDVSPKQIVSIATSLIPFLEHDDANRALMGSNMQRQAVPLLQPDAPLVGTGMERRVAVDSGQSIFAKNDGEVVSVNSNQIVVKQDDGTRDEYHLMKFVRTNQGTCINQQPVVNTGDRVKKGEVLVDSYSTDGGDLALGQNVLCAFMIWEGYNFEDAIIISEDLVKKDKFTSIHIEKHEVEARDTKLGPEEITRDIPNIGEESLRDLDEGGIVRKGAEVTSGDILVGKITPKGETELSAEEKLLRAIFGEKAREVKDSSLCVPHGERGTVIEVREFSRDGKDDLPPGVNKLVRVWVAQRRKVSLGDKLSGRHGNKGVIAKIVPAEDMPYLPDGRPVEIILNPLGVPSRMNLGQVLETHMGWAAKALGFRVINPVFEGARKIELEDNISMAWIINRALIDNTGDKNNDSPASIGLAKAWLNAKGYDGEAVFNEQSPGTAKSACLRLWLEEIGESHDGLGDEEVVALSEKLHSERSLVPPTYGKTELYDGKTGIKYNQPITVGYIYMMKLIHMTEDKIHARSTGPYSLITQQPLGGKAQFGGQRFGEMEVWALEAYGAAHVLQELLTIKSDDVTGRAKAYEAIVKGEDIQSPGLPESFKVLVHELRSLGISVEALNEEEERVSFIDEESLEEPRIDSSYGSFTRGVNK